MELRNYQKAIIVDLKKAILNGSKSPLICAPCGAGKTVIFKSLIKSAFKKNPRAFVLVLVHRLELIKQTRDAIAEDAELCQYLDSDPVSGESILIYSPVKAKRKLKQWADVGVVPSFLIIDEAHHAVSQSYLDVFQIVPNVLKVGFTATPCRLDGRGLNSVFDYLIKEVDTADLIKSGYLSNFKYFAPNIDLNFKGIKKVGGDYSKDAVNAVFNQHKNIYGDLFKYLDFNKKTIIYCNSVEFSKKLEKEINSRYIDASDEMLGEDFKIARQIDGDTDFKQRDHAVNEFKKGICRVLLNVDLIGEGFNVPSCDVVFLLRPTMSLSLFIQQAGRALRKDPANPDKIAFIYDFVGNCYKFGLPSDAREWQLGGIAKKVKDVNADDVGIDVDVKVRTCVECLRSASPDKFVNRICPYCGTYQPLNKKELKIVEDAKLEEIRAIKTTEERKRQGRARTYEELYRLAVERGYKNPNGWVYHIMKNREKKI